MKNMMNTLLKISRFVNKTFALWVVVFGVIGFIFPDVFKPIGAYVPMLLGVVMFGMGLTLSPSDFKAVFTRPRDVFVGVLAQFTIMPFAAFALCWIFGLPPDIAVGLMLLGCCPGGTASNVVTFLARGDVVLSVTITSCTTLLAPIVTPSLMYLLANQWLSINPMAMFISIVQVILIPIGIGVIVHKLGGRHIERATGLLPIISVAAIVTIVAVCVAGSRAQLLSAGLLAFAVVIIHNAIGMASGFFIGRALGMDFRKCACLCFEVGMQNSGLGVSLSMMHFAANPMTAVPSAVGALWHNITGPILATYFQSVEEKREAAVAHCDAMHQPSAAS